MIALVPVALVAFLAFAVVLFTHLPNKAHAVIAVFVLGVLFLPEVHSPAHVPEEPQPLAVPGIKLTKVNTIAYAVLLGALVGDRERWLRFRPRWFDLPVLVWCVCPLFSSVAYSVSRVDPFAGELGAAAAHDPTWLRGFLAWFNSLELYDGVAQSLDQTMAWGVPYLAGRIYLGTFASFRELAAGLVYGGLLYVPLCLLELRISPQLHNKVYGYHQHDFIQTMRFGGFRPMVFMEHGLEVGLWMVTATLAAFWLWRTGALPGLRPLPGERPVPLGWLLLPLGATAVLCKSTGALVLGAAGAAVLLAARWTRWPVALALLVAVPPTYMTLRLSGAWTGEDAVQWVATHLDEERAGSLEFRLNNESQLIGRALERPVFGWGGWGRAGIKDAEGKLVSVTDGLWILALGDRGFFGLAALTAAVLLPVVRFFVGYPPWRWSGPALAAPAAAAVLLALNMCDYLMNAQVNPLFMVAAGGLSTLVGSPVPEPVAPKVVVTLRPLRRRPPPQRRGAAPV